MSFTPAMELNSSPARCAGVPWPEEAKLISPGLALASAISSFTVRARSDGWTTSTLGVDAASVTGARSLIGSKGIFAKRLALIASGPAEPISIVYPSGADLATMSVPMLPPAPGRLSTTTCCARRSESFCAIERAMMSVPPPRPPAASMPRASPRATERRGGPSLPFLPRSLLVAVLRKILARGPEAAERRRITAVDRRVQQDLADLLLGDAVADGAVEMQLELLGFPQRDQHRDVQHAADSARQPRARPHHAPRRLGREHLHGHRELVGVLELPFDVLRAQHLLAQLQSLLEQLVSHFDAPDDGDPRRLAFDHPSIPA